VRPLAFDKPLYRYKNDQRYDSDKKYRKDKTNQLDFVGHIRNILYVAFAAPACPKYVESLSHTGRERADAAHNRAA
jgi:hypothetical protein